MATLEKRPRVHSDSDGVPCRKWPKCSKNDESEPAVRVMEDLSPSAALAKRNAALPVVDLTSPGAGLRSSVGLQAECWAIIHRSDSATLTVRCCQLLLVFTVFVLQKKLLKKQLAAAVGVERLDEAQKKQLGMVWAAASGTAQQQVVDINAVIGR